MSLTSRLKSGIRRVGTRVRYVGRRRYCPICGNHASSFQARGVPRREEVRCPFCRSLERHRLVWLFFDRRTDLWQPPVKRMLHIAPEACFEEPFRSSSYIDWLSADLQSPRAMVRMDVTDMHFPAESFDVVYCSHVLEHVPDDRTAMRELARVLKRTGWAVIQVPISDDPTFEDPDIVDPREREIAFGQHDHVRRYGRDIEERLTEAGFVVDACVASDVATLQEIERMRLDSSEILDFCRRDPAFAEVPANSVV